MLSGVVETVVNDSICKCWFSVNGYSFIVCSSLYGSIYIVYYIDLFGFGGEM